MLKFLVASALFTAANAMGGMNGSNPGGAGNSGPPDTLGGGGSESQSDSIGNPDNTVDGGNPDNNPMHDGSTTTPSPSSSDGSTTTPSPSSSDGSTTIPKTNADGTPFVPPVNNGTPACMNIDGTQAITTPCTCGTYGLHGSIAQTCAINTFCYWDTSSIHTTLHYGACLNNAKVTTPATLSGSSYCGPGTEFDGTHCVASYEAMINSCVESRGEWGWTCKNQGDDCNDAAATNDAAAQTGMDD